MTIKCKHCGKENCYAHCPERKDGKHEADPASIVKVDGAEWIVDLNCKFCGSGGATRIDPADIQWD